MKTHFAYRARCAAVAAIFAYGCGSPSTSSTPTDLSATAKARLGDYCTKRTTCATEENLSGIVCPTSACLASLTEESALLDYFDCQIAKQCSAFFNDDDCVVSAGTSDAERDAWRTQCAAKFTSCGGAPDLCAALASPLVRKQWMHAADSCIQGACADLENCIAALPIPDCW
jgi:non-ribosomal peptide synthetase component F